MAMTVDLRLRALRGVVTELIAFESDLEARLERDRPVSYLEGIGGAEAGAAIESGLTFTPATGVSGALRGICVAFNHGAISYAML